MIVDTSIKNDSLDLPLKDPKKDFKDLLTTAVSGDGVNNAKLNPMAISFVQNYISKNKKGFLNMKEWAKP